MNLIDNLNRIKKDAIKEISTTLKLRFDHFETVLGLQDFTSSLIDLKTTDESITFKVGSFDYQIKMTTLMTQRCILINVFRNDWIYTKGLELLSDLRYKVVFKDEGVYPQYFDLLTGRNNAANVGVGEFIKSITNELIKFEERLAKPNQ